MISPTLSPQFSAEAYDFELPERLIAQVPAEPRDSSRLLVVDRGRGRWEHKSFQDFPSYLDSSDLVVANNTRVLRARLMGTRLREDGKAGGQVEFFLLEELAPLEWEGLMKASGRYVVGFRFEFPTPDGQGLRGTVIRGVKDSPHGTVVARFDRDPVASGAGEIPLPHYIRRTAGQSDDSNYQTLYAKQAGSAAAPTAGLHFTSRTLEQLRARRAGWDEVTLNVGLGTFRSVKTADIRAHRMHEERYEISPGTAERITQSKRAGTRIVAIGTTTVRTLESAWQSDALRPGPGRTSIFIYPGAHEFRVVDRLLTNFHLPRSSLLMLVSAFAGHELIMDAYQEAVREKYRFFSYGDAMLVI